MDDNHMKPSSRGSVNVEYISDEYADLNVDGALTAYQLRDAAKLFIELAEYLERNK